MLLRDEVLVSVVMPARDGERYIVEAIESVINQTYIHWELLIVNDGSCDGTLDIAQKYAKGNDKVKVLSVPEPSGVAKARNYGISESRGQYVAFLDADDVWLPMKLEEQINFMKLNKCVLCFSAYEKVDKQSCRIEMIGVPDKVAYSELLKTNVIGCMTGVYDVTYFGRVFMPLNTKREDYAFWLMLLKKVEFAYGINKPLAKYRVHDASATYKKRKIVGQIWELFRKIEKLSVLQSMYYFTHYGVRGVLRVKLPSIARALGVLNTVE